MPSEYTPKTEDVREGYAENRLFLTANIPLSSDGVRAEFDRWLARVKADAAAQALEEAAIPVGDALLSLARVHDSRGFSARGDAIADAARLAKDMLESRATTYRKGQTDAD